MPTSELTSFNCQLGLSSRSQSAVNLSNSNTTSCSSLTTFTNTGSCTLSRQWSAPRTIKLIRETDQGLGISIVGGKVDLFNVSPGHSTSGIFVKNILPGSTAAKSGRLRRGDRILEVGGVDLRDATHDEAVEAIRTAQNPITLLVQSLLPVPTGFMMDSDLTENIDSSSDATLAAITSVADEDPPSEREELESISLPKCTTESLKPIQGWIPPRTPSPVVIQAGLDDEALQENQAQVEQARISALKGDKHDKDDEPTEEMEVVTKKLNKIKTVSLASETTEDSESEEEEINVRDTKGKVFSSKGVEVNN